MCVGNRREVRGVCGGQEGGEGWRGQEGGEGGDRREVSGVWGGQEGGEGCGGDTREVRGVWGGHEGGAGCGAGQEGGAGWEAERDPKPRALELELRRCQVLPVLKAALNQHRKFALSRHERLRLDFSTSSAVQLL